jgi:hypothetical protein
MPLALIALLIHYQDEMLLLVIVFLSIVLSLVGIGLPLGDRFSNVGGGKSNGDYPPTDIVIYHSNRAFKVIRCTKQTSRLIFK